MESGANDGMRGRILSGLAWKVASQVFDQGSRIAVALVLARLLTPHDYGLAAMVLVFSSLVVIFADLALGAALVQRRELSETDRSTVFWTSAAVGVLFSAAGIALSGPIAAFYGEPDVQPLFAAFSVGFAVTALGTTQKALLSREMAFRSLELRVMAGTAVGGVLGVWLALEGFGAWAIIGQQLAIAGVSTLLLWVLSPWRPGFTFSFATLRSFGGFSASVFGTRMLFYLNRNADNVLIGRFLGPAALGVYAVAYNVMLAPLSRIAQPVVEVLFPAFSRMQDDRQRLASAWLRGNRLIGALTIPGMLGLIVVAPEFVSVVLGDRWTEATPVIQILAWVGLIQSLQRLNSSILMACDRAGTLLRYSVVVLVASLAAFVLGLNWGIVGVATAYAISSTFVEAYYCRLTAQALGLSVWSVARSLGGVAQASVGMLACVIAAKLVLVDQGVPDAARLVVLTLLGLAVFAALCFWRAPEVRRELRGLRRARPEPAPAPA
jgi:O-antigen/teichoic acid export membrane protein